MNEPVQESLEVIEHTRWVYTVRFKLSDGKTILFSVRNVPMLPLNPDGTLNVDALTYTTRQQCEVTVDDNRMLVYNEYEHATAYIQELIDGNNLQTQSQPG